MSPGVRRQTINRITLGLLLGGFVLAFILYLTVEPVPVDPLLGEPLASKKFRRELKVLGGQANVLSAEFQDWFTGLWQGRNLSRTVAVLTVIAAISFRYVATHPGYVVNEPGPASGSQGDPKAPPS
jgi:hypothetical protein